jgi:hypothetical protein
VSKPIPDAEPMSLAACSRGSPRWSQRTRSMQAVYPSPNSHQDRTPRSETAPGHILRGVCKIVAWSPKSSASDAGATVSSRRSSGT